MLPLGMIREQCLRPIVGEHRGGQIVSRMASATKKQQICKLCKLTIHPVNADIAQLARAAL
jgi:hypothetical protein